MSLSDSVTLKVRASLQPQGLPRRRLSSLPGSHHPHRPTHSPILTPSTAQHGKYLRSRAVPLCLARDSTIRVEGMLGEPPLGVFRALFEYPSAGELPSMGSLIVNRL